MSNNTPHMCCARIKTYSSSKIGASERHNERKNNDYGNVNVDAERISMNVHFKDPCDKSYMDILREQENSGMLSRRGLQNDAVLFDELVLDVNTAYFEERGGYEYAKKFYREAYQFACEEYGQDNIISAVMHADEINLAETEKTGHPVYHYHIHITAFPVVDKEIRWSKRCKNPELVGTIKEVIHQISHSKKWESKEPLLDENSQPILRKNGKPKYRASYSVLQDRFFSYMKERGFDGFERGREGSTAEHLTSFQYQLKKDKERLIDIKEKIKAAELDYQTAEQIYKTYSDIDKTGKKTMIGNYTMSKNDYEQLAALAKEGITSRTEINNLREEIKHYSINLSKVKEDCSKWEQQFKSLYERCQPYIQAMEHFPYMVRQFMNKVRNAFFIKESLNKAKHETKIQNYSPLIKEDEEKTFEEEKSKQKHKSRGEAR